MNLVALLIAPLILQHVDENAWRITVPIIAVIILGGAITFSKRQKGEKLVPSDAAARAATAAK